MKISVIGAGAIGSLVAGYLKLKGHDLLLVGRSDSAAAIKEKGLRISGARGNFNIDLSVAERLTQRCDLSVLAVKTQDIERAISENLEALESSVILTTQNGVRGDHIVSTLLPGGKIISSIVMFGATYLEPARVVHNFEGAWVIGGLEERNEGDIQKVGEVLNGVFPTTVARDIRAMKYLKIFLNANNCIAAILGKSMQEAFSDADISRISISIWREGLGIISAAGINMASLPDFPLDRLSRLTSMPVNEAAKIYSGIMAGLSKEPLFGSILQSIKRGRPSEIDYINGEFVRLAKDNNAVAPLNKKLVKLVHEVENTRRFFSKEELLRKVKGLVEE
ncbi:MAG: ketopantoate reductase family protein [Candidatus Omnitrophica bacterium]|nr:ketopantoate reductase family protein [Candidatus Omnitrophota bacterium]MDD5553064.1 ketopantoate reductase family protein [Candidatus Omnitrophota bacterium]